MRPRRPRRCACKAWKWAPLLAYPYAPCGGRRCDHAAGNFLCVGFALFDPQLEETSCYYFLQCILCSGNGAGFYSSVVDLAEQKKMVPQTSDIIWPPSRCTGMGNAKRWKMHAGRRGTSRSSCLLWLLPPSGCFRYIYIKGLKVGLRRGDALQWLSVASSVYTIGPCGLSFKIETIHVHVVCWMEAVTWKCARRNNESSREERLVGPIYQFFASLRGRNASRG